MIVYTKLRLKLAHIKDVSNTLKLNVLAMQKTDFSELLVLWWSTYVWTSKHKTLSLGVLWTVTLS